MTEYDNLTTDDFLNKYERDNIVKIRAYFEEWEFSDSPDDFDINGKMCKNLKF